MLIKPLWQLLKSIIFTEIDSEMKIFKLTAALSLLILMFSSCTKDDEAIRSNDNIVMNGSQIAQTNTSGGTGKVKASYSNKTHLLSYTVTWAGLSNTVSAIRIQGPADPGFAGPVIQSFTSGFSNSAAAGSYSNTLYIDGFAAKESDLLNGKYYVAIYTTGTYASTGEIRGQIVFQ
jgi:hypothetical protein